jgi:formamidopyrimidine-DNA glycosylase
MPELPEVETTCRGIRPHVQGRRVHAMRVHNRHLRWPVPASLPRQLTGHTLLDVTRRAKYLLFRFDHGTLILHLGMSGSLRITDCRQPVEKHDHVEIALDGGKCLRLRDPRRFGAVLWTRQDPLQHKLLKDLGPEPLEDAFTGAYLYAKSRGRKGAIRDFLMNTQIVAGIGNIYANEALFQAGIRPQRAAGSISQPRYRRLVAAIRATLKKAIRAGGTTLRDFRNSQDQPGYFQQTLHVYGRAGEPCTACGSPLRGLRLGQRSAFFCPQCQT